MDRRHELVILAHSMAAMPPGQLALRREQAIDLLEELTELRGRHEALREALRRLADESQADPALTGGRAVGLASRTNLEVPRCSTSRISQWVR